MGATNIYLEIEADSLQSAWQTAYDQAIYEHGHNEYNGTISTTEGVIDKTDVLEKLFVDNEGRHDEMGRSIKDWEEQALDNTHKWDNVWGAKIAENIKGGSKNLYVLAGWAAV